MGAFCPYQAAGRRHGTAAAGPASHAACQLANRNNTLHPQSLATLVQPPHGRTSRMCRRPAQFHRAACWWSSWSPAKPAGLSASSQAASSADQQNNHGFALCARRRLGTGGALLEVAVLLTSVYLEWVLDSGCGLRSILWSSCTCPSFSPHHLLCSKSHYTWRCIHNQPHVLALIELVFALLFCSPSRVNASP
jgi:hypothetical protein